MKIFINKINEEWVVDNVITEWSKYQFQLTTLKQKEANIIWIIAPWTWKKLNIKNLKSKKVVCTIHHIDFEKFDSNAREDFYLRDYYVDCYHVVSNKTKEQLLKLTSKKIYVIPFWVNQNIFFNISDKSYLRNKYKISNNSYLIGSFQRDTEGNDLKSPKLSKGPDVFLEKVIEISKTKNNVEVLLAGKRRNYIITKLKENHIPFYYFEMVSYIELNELYNLLDLYIVASRVEGGPRALFECAITNTPIISTNVGFAESLLSPESIYEIDGKFNPKPNTGYSKKKVQRYEIPQGFDKFIEMFKEVYES